MGMAWPFGLSTGDKVSLGRVLVVDDEDSIRSVLRMMLTQAGYDVEEADDGGKAVEVLNSGDNPLMLDAIICDIRMPRINGVEAIAYFRAQYPSLPVIVLTGYHDEPLASSLRRQGIVEFLEKPAEREQILASVAQAIAGRRISFYP
ncbi:MAG TPA: response regulator [Nitrospira sp.]|nr:response regulator [Nitrospira sp.]MBX3369195.1 response regulator [Nitrospira sp.]MBX7039497.1 response regulator [Nitrospira sp.]MCW5794308.1 response regulator [Nitrospira sp.]HMU30246.1 response regulator [Nitrospira sp.]